MARVKIKGFNELFDVHESSAQKAKKVFDDASFGPETILNFGGFTARKRDVAIIRLAEQENVVGNAVERMEQEYNLWRTSQIMTTPRARAEQSAWGHFSLWYWGVFGSAPSEDLREDVIAHAEKFFESHERWATPSAKIWYEFTGIDRLKPMNAYALGFLERVESNEIKCQKI